MILSPSSTSRIVNQPKSMVVVMLAEFLTTLPDNIAASPANRILYLNGKSLLIRFDED